MNRKKYLGILAIITVACIVGGSAFHGFTRQHRAEKYEKEVLDIKEDIDDADDMFEDRDDADDAEDLIEARDDALDDVDDDDQDEMIKNKEVSLEGTQGTAFTGLVLDIGVGDVTFRTGDDYGVTYYVTDDRFMPEAEYKDGILYLKQKDQTLFDLSFDSLKSLIGSNKVSFTVTVPANAELESADMDLGVGDLKVDGTRGLTMKLLDVNTGTGDVELKNLSATQVIADIGTGDIELDDVTFDTIDIDVGTGDTSIEGVKDLKTYALSLDAGVGTIRINEEKQGSEFNWSTDPGNGSSDRYIAVDGGTGDIEIEEY